MGSLGGVGTLGLGSKGLKGSGWTHRCLHFRHGDCGLCSEGLQVKMVTQMKPSCKNWFGGTILTDF